MDRNDDTDDGNEPPVPPSGEGESASHHGENRSHSCRDRIVGLEQPHVRPIQRGKRPYPTEFGQKLHLSVVDGYTYLEQTSWNNFNEGCGLEAAVEGRSGSAKRRFGRDRLFPKLDETAKTEAALILLAMNACHRLARWRVLFFLKLFSFFAWPDFSADPIYLRLKMGLI